MFRYFFLLISYLILSSCSLFQIHKPIIEQGNIIKHEQIAKLQLGMSESEVRSIMGKPIMHNLFTAQRIDYIYTYQVGNNRNVQKLICTFTNGHLTHISQ